MLGIILVIMALLVIAFIVAVNVKRTSRNNGETIHLKKTQKNSPEEKVQPQDYRGVASQSILNKAPSLTSFFYYIVFLSR